MAENIGKLAQREKEKRLREQDEVIRRKVNWLSSIADEIEKNFSIIKELIRENKRNKKVLSHRVSIEEYKSKVLQGITQLENAMLELSALDTSKASVVSPHYKQKITDWKEQLKKLEPQIHNTYLTGTDDLDEFDKWEGKSFLGKLSDSFKENDNDNTSEQAKKEAQIINSIVFSDNVNELTQTLLNFGNIIDTEISAFDIMGTEHKFSAARTKFTNGLSLLKSIDPTNKMIPYFEERRQKWEEKRKLHIKYRVYIVCGVAVVILILVILGKLGLLDS